VQGASSLFCNRGDAFMSTPRLGSQYATPLQMAICIYMACLNLDPWIRSSFLVWVCRACALVLYGTPRVPYMPVQKYAFARAEHTDLRIMLLISKAQVCNCCVGRAPSVHVDGTITRFPFPRSALHLVILTLKLMQIHPPVHFARLH
jgi:hypothetical protein